MVIIMSIRGIDSQMMITRLPDNVKEASAIQKRPEVAQEFLAAQGKISDAEGQSKVAKTMEVEMEKIRTDVDAGGGGSYEGSEDVYDPEESGQEEEPDPDMIVPPGNNIIDIKI